MVSSGTDGHATERRLGDGFKKGRGALVPRGAPEHFGDFVGDAQVRPWRCASLPLHTGERPEGRATGPRALTRHSRVPGRHDRGIYPKGTVMMFWAPIALFFLALCAVAWRYDRKHKVRIIGHPGDSVDAPGNDTLRHDQVGEGGGSGI